MLQKYDATALDTTYTQAKLIKNIQKFGFKHTAFCPQIYESNIITYDHYFDFEPRGKLRIHINLYEDYISLDLRIYHGTISEYQRRKISAIVHEYANSLELGLPIKFHGSLIKNLGFYHETRCLRNTKELEKIASSIQFVNENHWLFLQGLDAEIFVFLLTRMYSVTFLNPVERPVANVYTLAFDNGEKFASIESVLLLNQYFSTFI